MIEYTPEGCVNPPNTTDPHFWEWFWDTAASKSRNVGMWWHEAESQPGLGIEGFAEDG